VELSQLNKQQQAAVRHQQGPLLILAGAGSGKTRALTFRLAALIEKGVKPDEILVVTFTNKAANEMKERVASLTKSHLGKQLTLPYLGTFHSVAVRVLRKELNRTKLPYNSDFSIYDQDDCQRLIRQIIKGLGLDTKLFSPSQVKYFISSNKQERIKPQQVKNPDFWQEKATIIYKKYQQRLIADKAMDFDDLLEYFLQLIEKQPSIREKYRKKFKHILVDEYQDTNLLQYQMIKLLVNDQKNLAVVGDDWQSIYGFRGADFRNILNFQKDYPDSKVIKLEENYRSTKNIVDAAQHLIEKNSLRSSKKLWTNREPGKKIKFFTNQTGEQEARVLAKEIRGLADYNQTAILYRTHAQSRLFEEALLHNQIPYQIIGGVRFFQRMEIKDLVAYLWLAKNDSEIHLTRIINTPRRKIGAKTLDLIKENNWQFDKVDHPAVIKFAKLLNQMRKKSQEVDVYQLLLWLINALDFKQYLKAVSETDLQAESRWENVEELLAVASRYQSFDPKDSLLAFLEEVALMDHQDELNSQNQVVTLMTLHNAKGLEFDNIFMVGVEEGVFPHQRSLDTNSELEEERRLCYVGMTRARDQLFLSHAQTRMIHGKVHHQELSRFVNEIPKEYLTDQRFEFSTKPEKIKRTKNLPLAVGDHVEHLQIGRGQVVEIEDQMVEIEFDRLGKKKFSLEYAPLKKIG